MQSIEEAVKEAEEHMRNIETHGQVSYLDQYR